MAPSALSFVFDITRSIPQGIKHDGILIVMLSRYTERNLTWVDCVSPTPAEVRELAHEFGFDQAIAEELLLPSFRPKVERRGEQVFVVLHFPIIHSAHGKHEQEVDFIVGKDFLITARYATSDPLHSFSKTFGEEAARGRAQSAAHGGHLFTSMARSLYQALNLECDTLSRRLRDIEEHIFSGHEKQMVVRISHVGRLIHDFRQSLVSHDETLASFESLAARQFGSEFSYAVHELIGSYQRIEERLNNLRESVIELRETNNALLSTKQNEIMKTLTVLAFIFLPLTFFASLFAMHTSDTPLIELPYAFWIIVLCMLAMALSFFVYFRHKDWL
jgi:magnesium transporter